jgi:hypothetical protein
MPRLAPAAVLSLLAFAAGAAEAAVRIADVEVAGDPVQPDLGLATVTVSGEVDCSSILLRQGAGPSVPLEVTWSGEDMLVVGDVQRTLSAASCAGGTLAVPVTVRLNVSLPLSVPAMAERHGNVTWSLPPSALDGQDPGSATAGFTVRPRPEVVVEVLVAEVTAVVQGNDAVWRLEATNRGNVRVASTHTSNLTLDGVRAPDAVVTADDVALEAGETKPFEVRATLPSGGWNRAVARVAVTFGTDVEPVDDPTTTRVELLVLAEAEGDADAASPLVPGLAAALLCALAARRR